MFRSLSRPVWERRCSSLKLVTLGLCRDSGVFVRSFSITDYRHPVISFETVVGKGVYVRSLAYDFGQRLTCGATLLSLRRTQIGDYAVGDAADLGAVLYERAR